MTMKRNEGQRPFIDKVAHDNREYVQGLLDDNQRLSTQVALLETDRDRVQQNLEHVLIELHTREKTEGVLIERLASVEEESRNYTARYVEVEQQNTNLANLYVASYQLHGTLQRDRVLGAIKEIVINLIGSEELGIWEVDRELGALVLIDAFGIEQGPWAAVPLDSPSVISLVATTGELFVKDKSLVQPAGREESLTACIPLKLDDEVVAVIGFFSLLQQKSSLEPVDYELFDLLGSHGASALWCTRMAPAKAEAAS
jgi:hypothetical protein